MTCNEARQHWNLYHDSEGDSELHFQINEHLGQCPDCAQWFAQQSRLESLLAEKWSAQRPTDALWDAVLEYAKLKPKAVARGWLWLAMAACIGFVLMIGSWLFFHHDAGLSDLTAQWHERLAEGKEKVAFASTSDLKVDNYLRKQAAFPVRCPPRADSGFAVQGAGVCTLGDQPAAYLLGKVADAPVSIFVLPKQSLASFPHEQETVRYLKRHRCLHGQYQMVMAVIDQNVVVVIGQSPSDRLERVIDAYGTYPHHEGQSRVEFSGAQI